MKSKYIVGQVRCDDRFNFTLGAVVFPEFVNHSEMARRMFREVQSAGFVDFATEDYESGFRVVCFGRSESLKLESNPEVDIPLVRQALGLEY